VTKNLPQLPQLSFLRRTPTQARGGDSVLSILNACEALLVKTPFDKLTIEDIALRAHVQVGSVYFFFRDKTSIFCSLIELTLREIMAEYQLSQTNLNEPLSVYLSTLYRRLGRLWKRHRPMREIWLAYRSHPNIWSVLQELWLMVDEQVERKLRLEFPELSGRQRKIAARVINASIASSLDSAAILTKPSAQHFRTESLTMICEYACGLGSRKSGLASKARRA
jgi:AcrR family transcriptional regulator